LQRDFVNRERTPDGVVKLRIPTALFMDKKKTASRFMVIINWTHHMYSQLTLLILNSTCIDRPEYVCLIFNSTDVHPPEYAQQARAEQSCEGPIGGLC
jgi:hypothetical protein